MITVHVSISLAMYYNYYNNIITQIFNDLIMKHLGMPRGSFIAIIIDLSFPKPWPRDLTYVSQLRSIFHDTMS